MSSNENNSAMAPSSALLAETTGDTFHSLLFDAVTNMDYDTVRVYVQHPHYDPSWQNEDGNAVFHIALMNGDDDMLSLLSSTSKPFQLNQRNEDGYTPLELALMNHHYDLVAKLIQEQTKETLGLPGLILHVAAQYNIVIVILQMLIQYMPESINLKNQFGETPFLLAVRYNHMPIVQAFLSIPQTKVIEPNAMGYSPLEVACFRDNYDMIHALIRSGRMPIDLIQKVVSYDNVIKGVQKNKDDNLIMFSNNVNEILVSYAQQMNIKVKRPPIKTHFSKLRFSYNKNIEASTGSANYKLSSHPSCLPNSSLFSLYSRLNVPKQMAILHQESLSIVIDSTGSLNISPNPAFLERLMSPSIPFLGQLYIDFTNIGEDAHVCAFLFLDGLFYIFDTVSASYLEDRTEDIFEFIEGELGYQPIEEIVNVPGMLEEFNQGYTIDLQAMEGTGYCTMWAATFIEDFYAQLPLLQSLDEENRFSVFKTIYDRYKMDPAYGYKYYQSLVARHGGFRKYKKTYKKRGRRIVQKSRRHS